ncbi:MAG: hypothetical protein RIQ75_1313 [Pseudomonadota bacterium]|jgi:hypothetical protein
MPKNILQTTSSPSFVNPHSVLTLPNSAIHTSVQNLAESLRQELVPKTAIERAAIEDFIQVECQRHRLRLMRDQIERTYAAGHVWTLLARAMIQQNDHQNVEISSLERDAELLVKRWMNGDGNAYEEILLYGIDIDEAISLGVCAHLPQLAELERQRDRLAQRARLLLEDIERAQGFRRKRKLSEIQDAEVL